MSIETSYNFRRVSDTVTTSGIVAVDDLASLKAAGCEVVVNLLPDSSEHAVEGEADIVASQGIGYVHIPVDFGAPTPAQFEEFAAVIDAQADRVIHVHCAANYRVSVFYALYAVHRGLWSIEEADEHIQSIWTPDPAWQDFIASERARSGSSA